MLGFITLGFIIVRYCKQIRIMVYENKHINYTASYMSTNLCATISFNAEGVRCMQRG